MFYISKDDRRVRSRLIDFAQAAPSHWNAFPTLPRFLHESEVFSKVLLKYHLLQESVPPWSPGWSSSLLNLNLQRVLVKDIRSLITSHYSYIAYLPQVDCEPAKAGSRLHLPLYLSCSNCTKQVCERQYDGVIIELCFLTTLGLNPSLVSVWPWAFLSLSFFVYKKETIIPSSGLLPGINEAKHARSQGKAPHMLSAQTHVNYC